MRPLTSVGRARIARHVLDEEKAAMERYRRMPPEEKIARAPDLSELA